MDMSKAFSIVSAISGDSRVGFLTTGTMEGDHLKVNGRPIETIGVAG